MQRRLDTSLKAGTKLLKVMCVTTSKMYREAGCMAQWLTRLTCNRWIHIRHELEPHQRLFFPP